MMKLRITHKKSKNDVSLLDLNKALMVRMMPEGTRRKKFILEVVFPEYVIRYSDSEYIFEERELSAGGIAYYVKRTVANIVSLAFR